MLVHHETLIQHLKDQHIPKYLANKQKNHPKYLVGPSIEVEVPLVTGCRDHESLSWLLNSLNVELVFLYFLYYTPVIGAVGGAVM